MQIDEEIREAMRRRQPVVVHLVSGESYRGVCEYDARTDRLTVRTKQETLELAAWTVKRILPV